MPLLGDEEFGISGYTAGLTFILVFGLATAVANYLAGTWGDRYGRKPVLVAGWLIAVAIPQRVDRPDAPSGPAAWRASTAQYQPSGPTPALLRTRLLLPRVL